MSRGQAEQMTLNPVIFTMLWIMPYMVIRMQLTLHWLCDVMMMCFVSKLPWAYSLLWA